MISKKYMVIKLIKARRTLYRLKDAIYLFFRAAWRANPSNRKVQFIVAGVQKGGTTALDAYLRTHKQISMPFRKELHYFDNSFFFMSPKTCYRPYHASFYDDGRKIRGECCPGYIYDVDAISRIYSYNPDIKIIVVLRNPVERAFSQWNMESQRGREVRSFGDAIREEIRDAESGVRPFFGYVERGFYARQIKNLINIFNEKNVLVLFSENLREKPRGTLEMISEFLQVESFSNPSSIDKHSRTYEEKISSETFEELVGIYESDTRELSRILNIGENPFGGFSSARP